jgi:hypothetical protein
MKIRPQKLTQAIYYSRRILCFYRQKKKEKKRSYHKLIVREMKYANRIAEAS